MFHPRRLVALVIAHLNRGTLLRRSLVLTGVLVAVVSAWITVISIVLVSVVDRTLAEPEHGSASNNAVPAKQGGAASLSQTRRAPSDNGSTAPAKPNG